MTFSLGPTFLVRRLSCLQYDFLIVMYSGHFYFTKLLLPALLAGAKTSSDGKARVVNISSIAAYMSKALDLEVAQDTPQRKKSSLTYLYSQSKLVRIPVCECLAVLTRNRETFSSQTDLPRDTANRELSPRSFILALCKATSTEIWASSRA